MRSQDWHTYFEFGHHTREAVLGALILALREPEWNITEIDEHDKWHIQTGINEAANNEKLVFHFSQNRGYMSSETTGDLVFGEHENRENVELLHRLMLDQLSAKTSVELTKTYTDFMAYHVRYETDDAAFTWRERLQIVWEVITFKRPWMATYVLIAINIAVFFAMVIAGAGFLELDWDALVLWGGNYTLDTMGGQYWRLLTNTFLHGGIMHLLLNMYGLLIGGLVAENMLGRRRFLIGYLLSGIVASAFSLFMHDEVMSVGASGAIFGCFGIVLGMATTNVLRKESRFDLLKGFGIFVGLSLLNGLKGNIDNWAHLGGLFCGWTGGFLWALVLKRKERIFRRKLVDILVPILAAIVTILLVAFKTDYFPKYYELLTKYDQYTAKGVDFYPRAERTTQEELRLLNDSGLHYLDMATAQLYLASEIKELPENKRDHLRKLRALNMARRDVFYFVYMQYTTEDGIQYGDSAAAADKRFKVLNDALKAQ